MRALVFLLLVAAASAKIFTRCELARALQDAGMDGYRGVTLGNWVCLAQWESSYNTNAIDHDWDGSTDYGIFQINSRYWCADGVSHSENVCQIPCSELLSPDLSAAIKCAETVLRVSENGISAWVGWRAHCEGQDVSQYIQGCGV